MLKKENRLNANFAFNLTYRNRNIVSTPELILYAGRLKQDKNCPTRVGFVVSKKVHKRAVKRNKIKRLLRESVRLFLKDIKTQENKIINNYQSLIFYAREEILDINLNLKQVQEIIQILLEKLNKNQTKNN